MERRSGMGSRNEGHAMSDSWAGRYYMGRDTRGGKPLPVGNISNPYGSPHRRRVPIHLTIQYRVAVTGAGCGIIATGIAVYLWKCVG